MSNGAISKLVQLNIGDYSHWLSERGLSPITRRGSVGRARRFVTFLSSREDNLTEFQRAAGASALPSIADGVVFDVKLASVIDEFITELQVDFSPGPATVNAYVTTISQLCQFCSLETPALVRLDYQPDPTKPLSGEEFQRYLNRIGLEPVRDQAAALILATSGIKLGQLTALNVEDISRLEDDSITLTIHRRGRKSLIVSLREDAGKALLRWLDIRAQSSSSIFDHAHTIDASNGNALFVGRAGRLTTSAVDQIVRKIGLRAGLVVSSEMLRRTALTFNADKSCH